MSKLSALSSSYATLNRVLALCPFVPHYNPQWALSLTSLSRQSESVLTYLSLSLDSCASESTKLKTLQILCCYSLRGIRVRFKEPSSRQEALSYWKY